MEEKELEESLAANKLQLDQINQIIETTTDEAISSDLCKLHDDLKQLISLQEENLLRVKKSRLLALLGDFSEENKPNDADTEGIQTLDDEFMAFQAELVGDVTAGPSDSSVSSPRHSGCPSPKSELDADNGLDEILGTKCRIPYRQEWGHTVKHNALVLSIEPIDTDTEPKVRVLFCNPTSQSMLTCPYFIDGNCKFSEEDCRFCHGFIAPVSDLEEFVDPDYSLLKLECQCLAKYEQDDMWYKGVIVDVLEDHKFKVMFDTFKNVETVSLEEILPCENDNASSDVEEDDTFEDDLDIPVFLWRPPQTTSAAMGEWEQHTKAIGSKLMAKMGYVTGQGLGRYGEGRPEPVPIQLLPPGKSLDKIMELREKAGNRDLYDVMKKEKSTAATLR